MKLVRHLLYRLGTTSSRKSRRIIETIHGARPSTYTNLEMTSRDPLKVPCLTDK